MSSTNVLALQALPETQPLSYPGTRAGALAPCTHTCGDSCQVTCVKITCRYGWTCASTTPVAAPGAAGMKAVDWESASLEAMETASKKSER